MPIPETDLARIRRWCDAQVPKRLWPELKVEADFDPRHVTVVEVRPPWDGVGEPTRMPIARLRWTASSAQWTLYWVDRNSKFHVYDRRRPTKNVKSLLDFIDSREDAIFWG